MTQDKRVMWNVPYLAQFDNQADKLYALNDRQVQFLLTTIRVAEWQTRWTDVTNFDNVQAFVGGVNNRLMTEVSICDLVTNCIETNDQTQKAILKLIGDRGNVPDSNPNNPINNQPGNVLGGVTCDFDQIYGSCEAIVDYVATVSRDILESVQAQGTPIGAIARAVDFLPIIGDLPLLDDLNEIVDWFKNNGTTQFDAGYTTTLRQLLICNMFSVACADCDLSANDIVLVFAGQSGVTIQPDAIWLAMVQQFLLQPGATAFTAGMLAMTAGALATGSAIGGIVGFNGLATIAASGDLDGDWALFCDPCIANNWCYEFDFIASSGGAQVSGAGGLLNNSGTLYCANNDISYQMGVGWKVQSNAVVITLPTASNVTSVTAEIDIDSGAGVEDPLADLRTYLDDPTSVAQVPQTFVYSNIPGSTTLQLQQDETSQYVTLGRCTSVGHATYKKVTIRGTGTNPFGADNCT